MVVAILPVRDVQTSIYSALEAAKHPGTSGCPGQTDIQVAAEGARLAFLRLHLVLITIHLLLTSIDAVQTKLLQSLHTHIITF